MYENYEKILKERGKTSYQVAKGTGIPTSTFSDWKNGKSKPKVDKLIKIAKFLGCSLGELLSEN